MGYWKVRSRVGEVQKSPGMASADKWRMLSLIWAGNETSFCLSVAECPRNYSHGLLSGHTPYLRWKSNSRLSDARENVLSP